MQHSAADAVAQRQQVVLPGESDGDSAVLRGIEHLSDFWLGPIEELRRDKDAADGQCSDESGRAVDVIGVRV